HPRQLRRTGARNQHPLRGAHRRPLAAGRRHSAPRDRRCGDGARRRRAGDRLTVETSFASAVVILLLVTDPIGNIPLFVALLRPVDPGRRFRVILRECAIALAVLVAFVLFGRWLLDLFGLSDRSLTLAGGMILFLISLRMIFRSPEGIFG